MRLIDADESIINFGFEWDDIPPTREEFVYFLKKQPAVDVVPVRHGRWIEDHDYLKCPECSVMVKRDFTFFDIGNWNYCPNCGAKMDGGQNNEC